MKVTLVGLHYSPWTQRAQWALFHHGIEHAYEEYVPVVGEPALRLRAGKLFGKLSVPVLLTPHGTVFDSIGIAKHADIVGKGPKLFDGHEAASNRWIETAEIALQAARGLVLNYVDTHPDAQIESVTLPIPDALKGPTARFGTMMLGLKYKARVSVEEGEARMASVLEDLRRALDGRDYLDGSFSLADIVMAGVVQAIKPVDDRFIPLKPATRASWTRPALVSQFPDLVRWRDALYDKHGPLKKP